MFLDGVLGHIIVPEITQRIFEGNILCLNTELYIQ